MVFQDFSHNFFSMLRQLLRNRVVLHMQHYPIRADQGDKTDHEHTLQQNVKVILIE